MNNIIGDVLKENPLLTRIYSRALLHEYMASRGIKVINLESSFVLEDLERFIKERKRSNDKYSRFLEGLTLNYRDSDTIENIDNKEFLISRTCDYDTTILSSDKKILDLVPAHRVILGNIKIYNGIPTIANKVKDGYHYNVINNNHFKTIMKTNPRVDSIKYFDSIKKISGFNIIVGINGNNYDYDKKDKINAMNQLSNSLDNDYIRFMYDDDDDYLYIIASKELKRRK